MGGDDEDQVLLVRVTRMGRWEEGRVGRGTGWWVLGLWMSRNRPHRALCPAAHEDTHGKQVPVSLTGKGCLLFRTISG